MKNRYALVDEAGTVRNTVVLEEGSDWTAPEGLVAVQSDEAGIGWLYESGLFKRPVVQVEEGASLADQINAALRSIDHDTDRIYNDTIGARGDEYRQAEADAAQFKEAGYAGAVPPFVADHLAVKAPGGWTAKQAADDILATATAWRGAQAQIRANRLQCKELARQAADQAGVHAALQQWSGFVAAIRGALGLSAS